MLQSNDADDYAGLAARTTHTPEWAKGMEKIGPGVYGDKDGGVHFSAEEICEYFNVAPTQENAERALACVLKAIDQVWPRANIPITEVTD